MFRKEFDEIKNLVIERKKLFPYYNEYEELGRKIDKIKKEIMGKCNHPFEYVLNSETDYYEGRSYVTMFCPTCERRLEDSTKYKESFTEHPLNNTEGNRKKLMYWINAYNAKGLFEEAELLTAKLLGFQKELQTKMIKLK